MDFVISSWVQFKRFDFLHNFLQFIVQFYGKIENPRYTSFKVWDCIPTLWVYISCVIATYFHSRLESLPSNFSKYYTWFQRSQLFDYPQYPKKLYAIQWMSTQDDMRNTNIENGINKIQNTRVELKNLWNVNKFQINKNWVIGTMKIICVSIPIFCAVSPRFSEYFPRIIFFLFLVDIQWNISHYRWWTKEDHRRFHENQKWKIWGLRCLVCWMVRYLGKGFKTNSNNCQSNQNINQWSAE